MSEVEEYSPKEAYRCIDLGERVANRCLERSADLLERVLNDYDELRELVRDGHERMDEVIHTINTLTMDIAELSMCGCDNNLKAHLEDIRQRIERLKIRISA